MRPFIAPVVAPVVALAAALVAAPAGHAAEGGGAIPDLADAARSAADRIESAAQDAVLIADLLGTEVTGPGGEVVGTVEDFAVIPGDRLVAVVLEMPDGERTAVPYKAIKVARATERVGVELPYGLDALRGDQALKALGNALGL